MIPIFLTTIITCNQLLGIVNRISQHSSLNYKQRIGIVIELQKHIPSCPVIIKKHESKGTASN